MRRIFSTLLIISVFLSLIPAAAFECEYIDPYITLFDLSAATEGYISVIFNDAVYKGYTDEEGEIINVCFASVSGMLSDITEAGFEINGKQYKVSDENLNNFLSKGVFGVGYTDPDNLLPETYSVSPYVITEKKTLKGEERIISKNGELSSVYAKWKDEENIYTLQGTEWKFYPEADYISHQNPPDFSWPYVEDAICYDLIISKDESFNEIYDSAYTLKTNYYNFDHTFDKDIYYYKVRFHKSGKISEWSEPRRFSIASSAVKFPVDDIDTMLSKIPGEHPRIAVNPSTAEFMKSKAQYSGHIDEIEARVLEYIASDTVQAEPETADEFFDAGNKINSQCTDSAIVYYFRNNKEAGAYAKKALLSLCEWDIYGTSSYVAHDTKFRDVIQSMAFTYSYIRDLLSLKEREKVLSVIKDRAEILINPTEGIMDAICHLKYSPYMSHGGSAVESLLEAAICLYGDLPEAEDWLRAYLPMYINYFPNWGREDGGWSQGTGYGQYTLTKENLRFTLYINGMVNMYNKPFFKNYYNYLIYNLGKETGASFGDESNGILNPSWALAASNIARATGNGYAMWLNNNCGYGRTGAYSRFYMDYLSAPPPVGIVNLPTSHYFKDIGWVSMLSEMNIDNRTATYFKSSPYGSHNHSHADQNTFTIARNGKELAIDSGYYDAYGSTHYSNYYELTYSHNGITYDNGKGQTGYAMCANGDIEGYIGSEEFDLAIGNAKNAYNYVYNPQTQGYTEKNIFDKMKRYFIYVRPDAYVVIDDIAFGNEKSSTLEWWLNAWEFEATDEASSKVVINNGTDALDVKMHYPKNTTINSYDGFVKPDGTAILPGGEYASMPQSKRINFKTQSVNATRFVATMQIRGSLETENEVTAEEGEGYIKLTFNDGTVVYVNLTDGDLDTDGILTDAVAVTIENGSFMMADGSYIDIDGKNVISADKKVSAYISDNKMSFFANEDSDISVNGHYSETYRDENGNYHTGYIRDGFAWNKTDNGVFLKMLKGAYTLKSK